jgi:hypothetical protein
MKKPKYIIYATTDGAGTHIIRSLFMELHDRGCAGPIDHSNFWGKALAAKDFPDAHHNDKSKTNLSMFKELCEFQDVKVPQKSLDDQAIFTIFDQIYSKYAVILDFSRNFTTESKIQDHWNQDRIDSIQDMIIRYIRSNGKIDVKVLVQIRNPLDHLASMHERFNTSYSMDELKNRIISNLINTKRFVQKLNKADHSEIYMKIRLDELILNYSSIRERMSSIVGESLNSDFYISKVSLNKWYSYKQVFPFLYNKEFIEAASDSGYNYPKLPKYLWFVFRLYGQIKRILNETKLAIDTLNGKVNVYNSINTKHKVSLTGSVIDRLLAKIIQRITYAHRSRYNQLLLEHNKKEANSKTTNNKSQNSRSST